MLRACVHDQQLPKALQHPIFANTQTAIQLATESSGRGYTNCARVFKVTFNIPGHMKELSWVKYVRLVSEF